MMMMMIKFYRSQYQPIIFIILIIWSSIMIMIIDTKIAYIIKIGGKKGAGNDV